MVTQRLIDYVDCVMSDLNAPEQYKIKLENELIRYIMEASENTSVDEVKRALVSPEKLAEELSKRLAVEKPQEKPVKEAVAAKPHRRYQRYTGEFMKEQNNTNIKLLYIPLIQLSSGTTRVIMPLTDEDDDEDD